MDLLQVAAPLSFSQLSRAQVPLCGDLMSRPDPVGKARWTMRCKPALNAFAIIFADRFPVAQAY